jgi:hypothetical protein
MQIMAAPSIIDLLYERGNAQMGKVQKGSELNQRRKNIYPMFIQIALLN